MHLKQYSTSFALFFAAVSAIGSPDNGSHMMKRASLLEGRQGCPTAGWIPACPGLFACVPPGAICCSDGFTYVMPPDTCDSGTFAVTTAGVGGPPPPPSTITTPPAATETIINYRYFTFEITWYYYYYYLTYIPPSTVTTSDQITTVTTVSVQATDSAQASVLFKSLSATIPLPTPVQPTTSLNGPPGPSSTSPSSTATPLSVPPSSTRLTTSSSASKTSTISTQAATTTAIQFTGGASTLSAGGVSRWIGGWVMGVLFVVPGLLMIWL